MKKIDGRYVVGVSFATAKDAALFEEMLAHHGKVAVAPHEFEAEFFELAVVDDLGSVQNINNGNVSGFGIQCGSITGGINLGFSGKRVQD